MSNYKSIKAIINANVKTNGKQEITGSVLNSVLNAMVNSLGAGYQFIGMATPTNPGSAQTPDYKCFYLATTPGTYTNLGGLVVADGEVAILKYDTSWTKEVTGIATAAQLNQLGQKVTDLSAVTQNIGTVSLLQGGITSAGRDVANNYTVKTGAVYYNSKIKTKPGYYIRGWFKFDGSGNLLTYNSVSSNNWPSLDASGFIGSSAGSGICAYYRVVFHKQNDSVEITPDEDIIAYFGGEDSIFYRLSEIESEVDELAEKSVHYDSALLGNLPVLVTDLRQGTYYQGSWSNHPSRVCSNAGKYYEIPTGKVIKINSSVSGFNYRVTLYDAAKNYISGTGKGALAEGPFDCSSYANAAYFNITINKIAGDGLTPQDCEGIFTIEYPYKSVDLLKEQVNDIATEVNTLEAQMEMVDKELFFVPVNSQNLVQGSYYRNFLTDNSKRVSSELIPISPGDTKINIVVNSNAFTGKFRLILYDSSMTYIAGSGEAVAAYGPFDISSWPTAKYYRFSYFNDASTGGNGSDITPSDCNNVFSVYDALGNIQRMWGVIAEINENLDRINNAIGIINVEYDEEAERVTAEIESSNTDLRLLVFTDPHSFDSYKYFKYAKVRKLGGIDGILGLGDYQIYVDEDKPTCIKGITDVLNAAGRERNCFYAIGNHDASCCLNAEMNKSGYKVLSQSNILTKKESWRAMQYHLNGIVQVNEADPYGGYFFVDFVPQKIRLVVLNASDIYEADGSLNYKYNEGIVMKQTQFSWFANEALDFSDKGTPSDWSVLVAAHWWFGGILAVLDAAKNGTRVNGSYYYTSRYTFDDATQEWGAPLVSESVSIDKDFSEQGPINVVAYLYGHTHCDTSKVKNGINILQFVCDNGQLNHMWKADLPSGGLSAGSYYFAMESGTKIQLTLSQAYANAVKIGYNHYFNNTDWTEVFLYDEDGQVIFLANCQATTTPTGTQITGFYDAETTLVSHEKCCVLCVNKDSRKIIAYPYGSATYREIPY